MFKFTLPVLLCTMVCLPAHADAGEMKPGLWEMTMKSDALKNMPKIPPEQMEQMRKLGVDIPEMRDGGIVSKVCITPEMVKEGPVPGMANETGCEMKNQQRSGDQFSADMICDGADMKGKGTVKGTYRDDGTFTSTYSFKGTVAGRPVNQTHETSGKWLSADCGDVRPMTELMPK